MSDDERTEAESAAEPDDDASSKAQAEEEEVEEAKNLMKELEEGDPPDKLEDWPGGKAKYQTYGGPDSGEGGYEDGATAKLGPSNLRHHEDGSVTIDGEEVDNPEEYKGEPIPGGPTDPDAPKLSGEKDESGDQDEPGEQDESAKSSEETETD
jgi:hypothetical protein